VWQGVDSTGIHWNPVESSGMSGFQFDSLEFNQNNQSPESLIGIGGGL
jgi:hypothetical protein